jgi:hypothetical protein
MEAFKELWIENGENISNQYSSIVTTKHGRNSFLNLFPSISKLNEEVTFKQKCFDILMNNHVDTSKSL